MQAILTRMGDGQRISMSASQIKEELLAGTRNSTVIWKSYQN